MTLDEIPFVPGMPCIILDDDGKPYAAQVENVVSPDDGKSKDAHLVTLRVYSLRNVLTLAETHGTIFDT